ncbi:O-linked N-acetylglucosamine transferase family protein [Selenomonas ruminantium]|uniref:protein O-GlcNAc transferase n=1 Tax=Selenomonas ruminantium TaxID=971 RepID=A0A1H3ZIS1_SELRU|nr:glycosyltransferase 61 family protein [Selenomonas ruminantium]SEA23144.1 Predicted O-linked N-acetylglucosamine transferase, SPINDLY family [Selenomonas ruminantium]
MVNRVYARNESSWEELYAKSYKSHKNLWVKEIAKGILLPPAHWQENTGEFSGGVCDEKFQFITGLQRCKPPGAGWYGTGRSYEVSPSELTYADEEVIFGGILINHFGHFMLECMGRMWYVLENRSLSQPLVFLTVGDICPWYFAFWNLLSIPRDRIRLIEKPTQFRKVIVPEEAVHSWYYYTDKYLVPYAYLRQSAAKIYSGDTPKKIFLIRGKLAQTATECINEDYFVHFFQDKGYVPVALEEMPLAQQICMVAHADKIVAIMGSLTHWALFCKPGTEFIMLTRTGTDTLLSQCLVNEAAAIDWVIVDVSMSFLHADRSYGVCLLGPTVYWQNYVADKYGEAAPPMTGQAYHDYLLAWSDYYLLPMNASFGNSQNFTSVLHAMNRELHLNDVAIRPQKHKDNFWTIYEYALALYRQNKLLSAWDEINNYEQQHNKRPLLGMLLKAYILRTQKRYVSEVKLLNELLEKHSGSRDVERLADAHSLLGEVLRMLGENRSAVEHFLQSAELETDSSKKAVELSNAIFSANACEKNTPQKMENLYKRYRQNLQVLAKTKYPQPAWHHDKIRVGYLSADWRKHPVSDLISPLLFAYNEQDFTVTVYQLNGCSDSVTAKLRTSNVVWRDMAGKTHTDIAAQIRADEIDILMDLGGHTAENALPVLAYKPAKIQIAGIGYFNSTGMEECAGFLSDAYCSPKEDSAYFTERMLRMPHSHFCYQPMMKMPEITSPPCQQNGYITFGSFNNFSKVNDEVLALWRQILEAVPNAHLLLKHGILGTAEGVDYTRQRLKKMGFPLARIELRGYSADYLVQYGDMDIALDTFPYTGGITTCEALYMGIPVVSKKGDHHGANFGYSILANIGLEELAAGTEHEYVNLAVSLSRDTQLLQILRKTLREQMRKSPLMDVKRYMQDLEQIYRQLLYA